MRYYITVFLCKIFIFMLRCIGKRGTSAPGKLAFRLYPELLKVYAGKVKHEIIAVMGTNGKTTTNNLLADYFEEAGFEVVCNRIGANMDEGSVVAFLNKTSLFGKIHVDYACLEMDEGWAEYILKFLTPDKIVVTNLFRDQLDRYGEIDITMDFLRKAIRLAPEAKLILNADDPMTVYMAQEFSNPKVYFGIQDQVRHYHSEIKEGKFCYQCQRKLKYHFYHFSQLGDYYCECGFKRPKIQYNASCIKVFPRVEFQIDTKGKIVLNGRGMYNIYNVLASCAAAMECGIDFNVVKTCAARYRPQIGRMEEFHLGKPVYLVLAKNPAGFNQSVSSVLEDPRPKDVMIAINDGIQDGRDVSWLWDVDFESLLDHTIVSYSVSGIRYGDMAVRLKYAGLSEKEITLSPEMKGRIEELLKNGKGEALYILVNYTALFSTQTILKGMEGAYER